MKRFAVVMLAVVSLSVFSGCCKPWYGGYGGGCPGGACGYGPGAYAPPGGYAPQGAYYGSYNSISAGIPTSGQVLATQPTYPAYPTATAAVPLQTFPTY